MCSSNAITTLLCTSQCIIITAPWEVCEGGYKSWTLFSVLSFPVVARVECWLARGDVWLYMWVGIVCWCIY